MSTEIAKETGSIGPAVIPPVEVPMVRQERWEELRRLWQHERVPIAGTGPAVCLGPQDGPPVSARHGVGAVSSASPARDAADPACRVPARASAEGPLLRPDPLPGVASAGVPGQLRHREAVRPASPHGAAVRRGHVDALRDAAGGAEPDRLGHGHGALPPAAPGAARLRAHPGLQPAGLLPGLSQ